MKKTKILIVILTSIAFISCKSLKDTKRGWSCKTLMCNDK
jgi:hypothetical protein